RQVGAIDLLAYITAAGQPALRDAVMKILSDSASLRSRANHVLQQSLIAERTLTQLWRLRMALPASVAMNPLCDHITLAHAAKSHGTSITPFSFRSQIALVLLAPNAEFKPQGEAAASVVKSSDFANRLNALNPAEPMKYFELAEEIADQAADEADLALARRLYGLAAVLDPDKLALSSCLALAQLAPADAEKRRLLALASILNTSLLQFPNLAVSQEDIDPGAAFAVSQAIALYRAGEGPRALSALKAPGAEALLQSVSEYLPGGINRFKQDCQLYRGQRAPALLPVEVDTLLKLEFALLSGTDRTWSSDLMLSKGIPLVEVDPNHLADTLGVDAERPIYRNGMWLERGR
ncbi:MAG TPA: hypothetical protein VG711_11450, partial [Phycisphaerales bacterium]|nr:hypothetical protein [Phycisphaerales bacterium]